MESPQENGGGLPARPEMLGPDLVCVYVGLVLVGVVEVYMCH